MTRHAALVLGLFLGACDPAFDPPAEPPHIILEDGALHARGFETPYLCADASGRRVACEQGERPPDRQLSCDAAGCHGGFSFPGDPGDADRHLRGSDGPSCFTCHDREWNRVVWP